MLAEKIPTAICLAACTASVLMGFAVGYVFMGYHDQLNVYAETTDQYYTEITEPVTAGSYAEQPHSVIADYDHPLVIDEDAHLYVVTALDGYIVIYHAYAYGGSLKEITSTPVGILAQEELDRLAQGIKIYSEEALAMILQDYGS